MGWWVESDPFRHGPLIYYGVGRLLESVPFRDDLLRYNTGRVEVIGE